MRQDAAVLHYLDMFRRTPLAESMAWSVMLSDGGPADLQTIATTLSGGAPPEVYEERPRMVADRIAPVNHFILTETELGVNIVELGTVHTNTAEFRRWLSYGCRLWSTSWHTLGGETIVCVEDDEVLFGIGEYFDIDEAFGSDLAEFQRELDMMRQTDITEGKADALAVMEMHGGMRLGLDWLDTPQTVVVVDHPIPAGATPPSAFASLDPELAEHLRNVTPDARQVFLRRLIDMLASRYEIDMPVSHDESLDLAQEHWFGPVEKASPEWHRWQAAIAIRQGVRSLDTGSRNMEALLPARNALFREWDALRADILALPTT